MACFLTCCLCSPGRQRRESERQRGTQGKPSPAWTRPRRGHRGSSSPWMGSVVHGGPRAPTSGTQGSAQSTSVSALGDAQIPQSTSFCGLAGVTHSLGEDAVKCGVASLGLLSNVTWLIHLGSLGRPEHPCGVCGGVSSRAKSPTIVQLVRYRRVTDSLSLHAIDTQVCNC